MQLKSLSEKTKKIIADELETSAHNYHPLPVVLERGKDCLVWDVDGKEYLDFLSAYSATNHGHCHPRLVKVMQDQCQRLTITSRAFYNSTYHNFSVKITKLFGYDMVLPMNTGAEAVETAIKMSRKWAHHVKKVTRNRFGTPMPGGIVLGVKNNFHGRTLGAISLSTDPSSREGFGPFVEGITSIYTDDCGLQREILFDDMGSVAEAIISYGPSRIAAFIVEPIQGEAGIQIPSKHYLTEVQRYLEENNILFIVDEIQCGLGRAGHPLLHRTMMPKPADIVLLGKALSGGMYPISCCLANKDIMLKIKEGQHGSTYGGNPLASAIACEALQIMIDEDLSTRSKEGGIFFLEGLQKLSAKYPSFIKECRGRGLFCAIELQDGLSFTARDLCLKMMENGMLSKPTHSTIIRLTPPLTIKKDDLSKALTIIDESLGSFE